MNNIGCTSPAQVTAILHRMRALGSNSLDHEGWLEYVRILRSILADEWEDLDVAYDWLNINVPYLPAMQEFHDMLLEELIEGRVRTLPPALSRVYPWSDMARDLADSFIELADCREQAMGLTKDEIAARQRADFFCEKILLEAEEDAASASRSVQRTARGDDNRLTQLFKRMSID
jgi:hypothetical protein